MHQTCYSLTCDRTGTHLHFDALVKLLAGGGNGLSGAELKVPEFVLHPEGSRKETDIRKHACEYSLVSLQHDMFGGSGHILKLSGALSYLITELTAQGRQRPRDHRGQNSIKAP